mmetsp:Transcript_6438/g.13247  ORF Transcript_6438/g.13247 Transcript_6438/m.13247 type:complete len:303 (-) Transcript_6438:208-1116(-)
MALRRCRCRGTGRVVPVVLAGRVGVGCGLVRKVPGVIHIVLQVQLARLGTLQPHPLDVFHAEALVHRGALVGRVFNVHGHPPLVLGQAVLPVPRPQPAPLGLEKEGVPGGRPERRRVGGDHVDVLFVDVRHVDGKGQAKVLVLPVVALPRPVPAFSPQDHPDVRVEPELALEVVLLVAQLEDRDVAGGDVDGNDNVVKGAPAPGNVHVHVFRLGIFRQKDRTDPLDHQALQVEGLADLFQDLVEAAPPQDSQEALEARLVPGIQPDHVGVPGSLDHGGPLLAVVEGVDALVALLEGVFPVED